MKADKIYMEHIVAALNEIIEFTENTEEPAFMQNKMMQSAVIRQFEIIGEASKKVSEETRIAHKNIPWKFMSGMRDKLIHDYIDVDLFVVWKTVNEDVPVLKIQIENLLNQ